MEKLLKYGVVFVLLAVTLAIFVTADPEPPTNVDKILTSRHNTSGFYNLSGGLAAQAGNVTYLNITAETTTETWAAYYGNISGTMKLENIEGQAIYSWNLANPGGKVLATQSLVSDWTDIHCWNWSKPTGNGLRASEWDIAWGVTPTTDVDRINNTFAADYAYTDFYLTSRLFSQTAGTADNADDLCPAIQLYNGSGVKQAGTFEEIILGTEAPSSSGNMDADELIYTALIERTAKGFTGEQVDFQIIVPNDQHGTNTDATAYYFYVELEAS